MAEIESIDRQDRRLRDVFSYPHFSESHYSNVLRDLEGIGAHQILSKGEFEIGSVRVVGKGWVGIVCVAYLDGKEVALKVRRSDANRVSMKNEGELLSAANSCAVGPRLLRCVENVLAMEYIEGPFISPWLKSQPEKGQVRGVVWELLEQCFRLDAGGVDHGELSDSKKHVIVNRLGKPHIIDFETASRKRKCRNLVSMVGYLFFKDSIGELLKPHFAWDKEALKEIIRHYKVKPSTENYIRVCEHLGFT